MARKLLQLWIALAALLLCQSGPARAQSPAPTQPRIILQTGHSRPVEAVAWTADSQFVITGSSDRQLLLWDLAGHVVDRVRLPPLVAEYVGVEALELKPGGVLAYGTYVLPSHSFAVLSRVSFDWTFGRSVVRLSDTRPHDHGRAAALDNPDGLRSPDGLKTLRWSTPYTTPGFSASDPGRPASFVKIVRLDKAAPPVALVGQSGLSDPALAYLADVMSDSQLQAQGLADDLAMAEALKVETLSGYSGRSDPAATLGLSPDARLITWLNPLRVEHGAQQVHVFDLTRGAYLDAPQLGPDYDHLAWIGPHRLAALSERTNTSIPVRILDLDKPGAQIAGPALCGAVMLDGRRIIGSGASNCRAADCPPKAGGPCPAGPAKGLWLAEPGGEPMALDHDALSPDLGPAKASEGPIGWGDLGVSSASADGALVAGTVSRTDLRMENAEARKAVIVDVARGRVVSILDTSSTTYFQPWFGNFGDLPVRGSRFADDGRILLGVATNQAETWALNAFDTRSGRKIRAFTDPDAPPEATGKPPLPVRMHQFSVSPDGKRVAIMDIVGRTLVFDVVTGAKLGPALPLPADALALSYDPVRPLFWVQTADGAVSAHWQTTGAELFTLYSLPGGRFFVVDPSGRYDTNLPADTRALRWVMADRPTQSLAPQTFMRDYYQPRLMQRLLACVAAGPTRCKHSFGPVRSMANLNRVLPRTKILATTAGPLPGTARIAVEVVDGEDANAPKDRRRSEAYDLRLFRDGRLVARWPEPPPFSGQTAGGLETWRKDTGVITGTTKNAIHIFTVPVPTTTGTGDSRFTAYAFNRDRVKGETDMVTYHSPTTTTPPRRKRLYVLAIGENRYDNPAWSLNYAAADARLIAERLGHTPGFDDVNTIRLVSDGAASEATKANIRDALALLSGHDVAAARGRLVRAGITAPDLRLLQTATPDDAVIVSFSGHGWASGQGDFYLVPSDGGLAADRRTPDPRSLISSAELTDWMRRVDAGEMAIIIDACHSAASVEADGFKAGPFGDAGLGQLAFDKGIRILAGAQADAVAMEDAGLGQGLLTYALAREGLGDPDAKLDRGGAPANPIDGSGKVALDAWLRYAAQRLPSLSQQVLIGRMSLAGGGREIAFDPPQGAEAAPPQQEPSLFDFTGQPSRVVLTRVPAPTP